MSTSFQHTVALFLWVRGVSKCTDCEKVVFVIFQFFAVVTILPLHINRDRERGYVFFFVWGLQFVPITSTRSALGHDLFPASVNRRNDYSKKNVLQRWLRNRTTILTQTWKISKPILWPTDLIWPFSCEGKHTHRFKFKILGELLLKMSFILYNDQKSSDSDTQTCTVAQE